MTARKLYRSTNFYVKEKEVEVPVVTEISDADILNVPWSLFKLGEATEKTVFDKSDVKNGRGIQFKSDGTKFYIVSRETREVVQCKTKFPFCVDDLEIEKTINLKKDFEGEERIGKWDKDHYGKVYPHGLYIRRSDGKYLYVLNRVEIWQYELETPWEVDTAVFKSHNWIDTDDDYPYEEAKGHGQHDITFSSDGSYFYVDLRHKREVFQYKVKTPWDITTIEFKTRLKLDDYLDDFPDTRGTEFDTLGKRLFVTSDKSSKIAEFHLSDPYELDSATLIRKTKLEGTEGPTGIEWTRDGMGLVAMHLPGYFGSGSKYESIVRKYPIDDIKS